MRTAFVTGAGRGLGLELTRQLAEAGWRVVATARELGRAERLRALAAGRDDIDVVRLDVTDAGSAAACAERLVADDVHLDLLVNNAGVWDVDGAASRGPLGALDGDALVAVLRTNAVGALLVTQALAPRLAAGAAVANVSSGLGSLGRSVPRRNYGYALSKAALNMVTRCLAAELGDRAVTVISLDPGWVRTDLGGPNAALSPEEAVASMLRLLDRRRPEWNGTWLNRHGEEVPW